VRRSLLLDALPYGRTVETRSNCVVVTYIAIGAIAAFTVFVVAIAAVVLLEPLFRPPIDPTDWIGAVFAGVAAVLAGSAGITVGLSADTYNSLSWAQVAVGGMFAVVGIVLTVIGVWIYEPLRQDAPEEPVERTA
jgi:hypothetical protein